LSLRIGRGANPALIILAVLGSLLCSSSCVQVDGGAVELSWTLRDFDGEPTSCIEARIDEVRICWESIADGGSSGVRSCRRGSSRSFACAESRGVTGFEIPPGRAVVWIEPVCVDGLPPEPDTYEVPAPIARTVETGQVVTLGALLIQADDSTEPCPRSRCTCQR
jgi:hypothetical protein